MSSVTKLCAQNSTSQGLQGGNQCEKKRGKPKETPSVSRVSHIRRTLHGL